MYSLTYYGMKFIKKKQIKMIFIFLWKCLKWIIFPDLLRWTWKVMGKDMGIEKTLSFKWVNPESEGNDLIVRCDQSALCDCFKPQALMLEITYT